jgi:hypothetical protein
MEEGRRLRHPKTELADRSSVSGKNRGLPTPETDQRRRYSIVQGYLNYYGTRQHR